MAQKTTDGTSEEAGSPSALSIFDDRLTEWLEARPWLPEGFASPVSILALLAALALRSPRC